MSEHGEIFPDQIGDPELGEQLATEDFDTVNSREDALSIISLSNDRDPQHSFAQPPDFVAMPPSTVQLPVPVMGKTALEKSVPPLLGEFMEGTRLLEEVFLSFVLGNCVNLAGTEIQSFSVTPNSLQTNNAANMGDRSKSLGSVVKWTADEEIDCSQN